MLRKIESYVSNNIESRDCNVDKENGLKVSLVL